MIVKPTRTRERGVRERRRERVVRTPHALRGADRRRVGVGVAAQAVCLARGVGEGPNLALGARGGGVGVAEPSESARRAGAEAGAVGKGARIARWALAETDRRPIGPRRTAQTRAGGRERGERAQTTVGAHGPAGGRGVGARDARRHRVVRTAVGFGAGDALPTTKWRRRVQHLVEAGIARAVRPVVVGIGRTDALRGRMRTGQRVRPVEAGHREVRVAAGAEMVRLAEGTGSIASVAGNTFALE